MRKGDRFALCVLLETRDVRRRKRFVGTKVSLLADRSRLVGPRDSLVAPGLRVGRLRLPACVALATLAARAALATARAALASTLAVPASTAIAVASTFALLGIGNGSWAKGGDIDLLQAHVGEKESARSQTNIVNVSHLKRLRRVATYNRSGVEDGQSGGTIAEGRGDFGLAGTLQESLLIEVARPIFRSDAWYGDTLPE